ncbi:MAG TPA: hypothetical protein VNL38_02950 [Candidatus Nitrosotenuis sp.]|nr:hypothetical protein [Candidatus Nitrosotenuis sp.]
MPHDRKGNVLQEGDRVLIPARVKSVQAGEECCNVDLETEIPMPPYTGPTMIVLNTRQVEKVEEQEVAPSA